MNRNFLISKETLDRVKLAKKYIENRYQAIIQEQYKNKEHWRKIMDSIDSTAASFDQINQNIVHKQTINKRLQRQKDSLENYQLHNIIGRGAFGEVRLAQNIKTKQIVAIKRLQKKKLLEKKQIYNAYLERDFMVHGTSSFLVQLKSAFQDENYLYIAMQYVAGGDLLRLLIEKDILSEEETRFYIAELILAVEQIHKMNYIHRDIKPDNILIDMEGHIKISDFGLSKYLQKDDMTKKEITLSKIQKIKKLNRLKAKERTFSKVGTPDYISPEVLVDCVYDHSVDIWGIGVIMFECLFGYPPFTDDDSKEVCHKVMNWVDYLEFPDDVQVSTAAKMLILGLINKRQRRLTIEQIKNHPFFQSINWSKLHLKKAPHVPKIKNPLDSSNFDEFQIEQPWISGDCDIENVSGKCTKRGFNFPGFDFKPISEDPLLTTIKSLEKTNKLSKEKVKKNMKNRLKTEQCERSSTKRSKQNMRHSYKPGDEKRWKKSCSPKQMPHLFNKSIQKQNASFEYCSMNFSSKLKPFKKMAKVKIENVKQAYSSKGRTQNLIHQQK